MTNMLEVLRKMLKNMSDQMNAFSKEVKTMQ